MIFAANHHRHLHQRIVDDGREVVRRVAVSSDDDGIADDIALKPHLSANDVVEGDVAAVWHFETDGRTLAGGDARLGLLARDAPARAGILRWPALGERGLPLGIELRDRTEAVIRMPGIQELVRVRRI